jgi:hypothetical protein
MADFCPAVIHLCYVRFTRISSVGVVTPGPNNVYVIDTPITLTTTPDVLAGEVKDQKSGCDKLIMTYRGQDIVKRENLELDIGQLHPGLEEMLTGGSVILDAESDPIGVNFPEPCGTFQPSVVLEAWQDLWLCDHQPSSPYQYRRLVLPGTRWIRGAETEQNDFTLPKFTGYSFGNPNWGIGIYGDYPIGPDGEEAIGPQGGWFFDNTLPTAACGFQTQALT